MSAAELTRRGPLDQVLRPGRYGAERAEGPGVTITERRGIGIVQVMARDGREPAVADALGLDPAPLRASTTLDGSALWIGPGTWLVVAGHGGDGELLTRLQARLGPDAALADQSHGRTVLRLAGSNAREVLAKGCRLDLHPRACQAGTCAPTAIGQIGVLLHQVDTGPTYDLYVFSGYAVSFWEWLTVSAAEFGYRVQRP